MMNWSSMTFAHLIVWFEFDSFYTMVQPLDMSAHYVVSLVRFLVLSFDTFVVEEMVMTFARLRPVGQLQVL